jgi:hypothetical protein
MAHFSRAALNAALRISGEDCFCAIYLAFSY